MAPDDASGEQAAEGVSVPWLVRMRARLGARRLDRRLAAGADPDATPELRRRARRLSGVEARHHLAEVLDRIRSEAGGERRPFESASPLAREAIRGCPAEIEAIIDRLKGDTAPPPRGIARVALLVHDPPSPLLHPETSEVQLRKALDSILRDLALDEISLPPAKPPG
jgi:hypothetical protein